MKIIDGGLSVDKRGVVSFVNDFDFRGVKRFYVVENHAVGTRRAWHGHKKEAKYVTVVSGTAKIAVIDMETEASAVYVLSEKKPQILHIPPGYYNGSMSLTPGAKIIYFSTSTLEESLEDDFRKDQLKWIDKW